MYAEHFGFSKLPFSLTPEPQSFFNNSLYREAFAKLQHGVLAKKGFMLITGEAGTGKTALLRRFLHNLGPAIHSIFILDPQVGFTELLGLILEDLNLPRATGENRAMIQILNHHLIQRLRQGQIVTLLIDDAQNSCDETLEGLRLLSNLSFNNEKLLQIVLVGRPELETRLDHPKLRWLKQRITIQCRLAPLKREEVGAYIEFQLNAAGSRDRIPFQAAALPAIAFYSKGIPRLINTICENALLAAFAASKPEVSAQMVDDVARDLKLGPPRPIEARHPVTRKIPDNRDEPSMQGEHLSELENLFIDDKTEHRLELQRRRRLTALAVGIFLGGVVLGGIAVSYSQQSKIYFSVLSTRWEDFSQDSRVYLSDWTVKVKDSFERTPVWMREAVGSHLGSSNQVKPVTNSSSVPNDVHQTKRTQPLFSAPWQLREKPSPISPQLQQAKPDNKVSLPAAAETQTAKNSGPLTDSGTVSDAAKGEQTDSRQPGPLRPEAASDEASSQGQTPNLGNFEVVGKTFVRNTPGSDAEIITTLKPGTLVRVEDKSGKYLEVRSSNDPKVHGYVHQEDAFFKRVQ